MRGRPSKKNSAALQRTGADTLPALRQEAGKWLRELRELRELSQRELAEQVGIEYYTFISQIESGRGRIPPAQMKEWAKALGVVPRRFAIEMMRYYDPYSYDMIFGSGDNKGEPVETPSKDTALEARLARLEELLAKATLSQLVDSDVTG